MTLAPRPLREDGMEETAGLFSSPEKSPPKPNGVSHRTTTVVELEEDETMNIGSSMSWVLSSIQRWWTYHQVCAC